MAGANQPVDWDEFYRSVGIPAAAETGTRGTQYFPPGRDYGYNISTGNYEERAPGQAYATVPAPAGIADWHPATTATAAINTAAPPVAAAPASGVALGYRPPPAPAPAAVRTSVDSGGDPWAGLRGTDAAAATADGYGPAPETSTWDNIVNGAGSVLEHTALGGIISKLFPDQWASMGNAVAGIDNNVGSAQPSELGRIHGRNGPDFGHMQNGGSLLEVSHDHSGPHAPKPGATAYRDRDRSDAPTPSTPIPPIVANPNTPAPTGGNDAGWPSGIPGPKGREATFPDMPPYRPGIDPEHLYFRNKMADGGIVGYADGGQVDMLSGQDPRVALIADTEDVLGALASGQTPDQQQAETLKKFVAQFGDEALRQLHGSVGGGMSMRGKPRMVEGPGGPRDDAIPARVNGVEEAALSDGEFVMPAAAVAAVGEGDPRKGAEKLQRLSEQLAGLETAPLNVERAG